MSLLSIDVQARTRRLESLLDQMMNDSVVAVVHGGDPRAPGTVLHETVNPRGTKTYRAVAEDIAASLRHSGFRKVHVVPDGLNLGVGLAAVGADMVWVNSGGVQGHDAASHTPAMLEMMGLPYIGHDPLTVALLDNKHVFKHVMQSLGVPTAPFIVWNGAQAPDSTALRAALGGEGPYVAKPVSGRASNHVVVVDRLDDLPDAMRHIHAVTQHHVLVEAFLPGAEYAVAVCGGVRAQAGRLTISQEATIFSPVERLLAPGERIFTSMDVAPITHRRLSLLGQDDPVRAELTGLARAVYGGINLATLVRLDVRAGADGVCRVLEANPKPDLKAADGDVTNIVSLGLPELGMTYDDLILSLFADRLCDYATRGRNFAPGLSRFFEASLS